MTSNLGYVLDYELKKEAGWSEEDTTSERIGFFWFLLFFSVAVLLIRLVWLQIVEGKYNLLLSEENRILARRIQAPRGVIKERNGEVLAQNIPVYKLKTKTCSENMKNRTVAEEADCGSYKDISRDEALRLQAEGQGKQVVTLVGRSYTHGRSTAHLIGFASEIDKDELELHQDYGLGDLIGKMGVELYYEPILRGQDGAELVEIDAKSSVIREVARKEPNAGKDIVLTIDLRLQEEAFELMRGRGGALVALEPKSGRILTLVSSPSFDPNNVAVSLEAENTPFFNRSVGGLYPPGSVFKVVTATAGLEEGKINEITQLEDTGEIRVGSYRYGNWYFDKYGRKEGSLDIVKAIKRSNDIFFYRVGELVGATRLSEWAKQFGFGQKTGIDLPGEAEGLVPSPLWKERMQGERWFLGNTYHFAIGQSDLEVTPLQVAQMTSVVASDGKLCRPHVLDIKDNQIIRSDLIAMGVDEENCRTVGLKDANLELVKRGMVEACSPGGTAFPFFNFAVERDGGKQEVKVACKTGTAEFGDPQGRTHAWFTVFAPAADPEIVVTVLLEKAGEGSYEAAPVARELLDYYFSKISQNPVDE